ASGAVIPGAKLSLTTTAGLKVEKESDEKGSFSFTNLEVETYTLTVTAPGFAASTFTDIALTAGQQLSLECPLQPESTKSEVNVDAKGTGQAETETTTVSSTITEKENVQITLNNPNLTQPIP